MAMLRLLSLHTRTLRPRSPLRLARSVSSSAPPLIRIQDATFYDSYPTPEDEVKGQNPALFPNLSFVLPSKPTSSPEGGEPALQHWAVIGSSGRTQFLDILRGQYICIPPTARSYPYLLTDEIARKNIQLRSPANAIQYIGFSGEGSGAIGGTRGAYLSARYESLREETDWTVRQYLRGQTSLNPLEEDREGNVRDEKLLSEVITELRLEELLEMPVANLSNGQTRRTRIAKALLSKPELLLLDDPFMGLDPATVRSISDLLHRLATKSDPRLVLSLRPQDTLPDWITHLMVLGNSNRVLVQGTRSHAEYVFDVWSNVAKAAHTRRKCDAYREIFQQAKDDMAAGYLDRQLLWDLRLLSQDAKEVELPPPRGGEPLIEMDGVRVQYGDKAVLGDWTQKVRGQEKEGLHWTVRRGQRWVVLGANGSGKTTLLSLITSDHPQAYALPVKLFGRSRLPEAGKPGISIFELQSRIGHSSPEIHAFFPRQLTIRQAIESAFAETFLAKPTLNHERDLDVSAVLRFFKAELDPNALVTLKEAPPKVLPDRTQFPKTSRALRWPYIPLDYDIEYADSTTFGQLSTAQQRLILFLRAVVHKPDIVILDEPFSSMSGSLRDKCIHFLELGEQIGNKPSTATRRAGYKGEWLRGFNSSSPSPSPSSSSSPSSSPSSPTSSSSPIRHHGLSETQALVMISHVREEIPDSVRHYMRLPSAHKGDETALDFRFGSLKYTSSLNDPQTWDLAWASADRFKKKARRSFRRSEALDVDAVVQETDEEVYEWYSF